MKNSQNLDKFRKAKSNIHYTRVFLLTHDGYGKPITAWEPRHIKIGRVDNGDLVGARLSSILVGNLQVWCHLNRAHAYQDISEQFWLEYERDGRCTFDRAHAGYFQNDDDRYTTVGDIRTCHWCGANHVRHVEKRTIIKQIETWNEIGAQAQKGKE